MKSNQDGRLVDRSVGEHSSHVLVNVGVWCQSKYRGDSEYLIDVRRCHPALDKVAHSMSVIRGPRLVEPRSNLTVVGSVRTNTAEKPKYRWTCCVHPSQNKYLGRRHRTRSPKHWRTIRFLTGRIPSNRDTALPHLKCVSTSRSLSTKSGFGSQASLVRRCLNA